jgi:hypothetical protein
VKKVTLSLQPSEAIVARSAANIYAAYVASGRVPEGQEREWIDRALRDAILIAQLADEAIISDSELH